MATVAVLGARKLARFNRPDVSRHDLIWPREVPLRVVKKGPAALRRCNVPLGPVRADLVHTFALVPLTRHPWVCTFEQHLPRLTTAIDSRSAELARRAVRSPQCRALIAMSEWSRETMLADHRQAPGATEAELAALAAKTTVIHPFVAPFPVDPGDADDRSGRLRAVFVGGDFARKGGVVVLRCAREAAARGLPIDFHLVSALAFGSGWVDHPDRSRLDADLALLELPNVVAHGALPLGEARAVLGAADVQVMPTLNDTFGFSVVEGLVAGVPAVVSDTCALPEIVGRDDPAGALLDLECGPLGRWVGCDRYEAPTEVDIDAYRSRRASEEYWSLLDTTWTSLADQLTDTLERLVDEPDELERMKAAARRRAAHFSPERSRAEVDRVYDRALR